MAPSSLVHPFVRMANGVLHLHTALDSRAIGRSVALETLHPSLTYQDQRHWPFSEEGAAAYRRHRQQQVVTPEETTQLFKHDGADPK
jgi:hypothetical protein